MCLHIGPCCDFWADDGMCVCNPVDAAEYPQGQRLYIAGNISGFSSPNIRTIFPDGHDHVRTFNRGDYCWQWWEWGSTAGTVKFELRDGNTVRASRSTYIAPPPPPPSPKVVYIAEIQFPRTAVPGTAVPIRMKVNAGNVESLWYTAAHVIQSVFFNANPDFGYTANPSLIVIEGETIGDLNAAPYPNLLCRSRRSVVRDPVSPPFNTGRYARPTSVWLTCSFIMPETPVSGTIILATTRDEGGHYWPHSPGYHYMDKRAFSVGVKPCNEGEKRNPKTCWDGSVIHKDVCKNNTWVPTGETCPTEPAAGEKRSPKTCWDRSVIHAEKYDATLHRWVPSGETCPPEPEAGEKRSPVTCWDKSVIHAEKYDAALHRWVPSGETCPPEPAAGEKRLPVTCWDRSIIHAEKYDVALHRWVPSGETCPIEPPDGAKRSPKTCWDRSVIHAEVYDAALHRWVPSGETCPPEPAAGEKRGPKTCWDRSVIHAEKFDATLKQWVLSGEKCPPKPECTEGDKKPGHICVAGKWKAVTVPEPVVEPDAAAAAAAKALAEAEAAVVAAKVEACYIKFDIPWLDLLPGIPCPWWVLPILPGLKKTKEP